MDVDKLKTLISLGENSQIQFKEKADSAYKIGCEMVAFSNSQGGIIIIGINDKNGDITGLTFSEVQQTANLLANAATENIIPSI